MKRAWNWMPQQMTDYPVSLTDIVSAAIAAHRRTSTTLAEPGATQAAAEAIRSLVERYADGRGESDG